MYTNCMYVEIVVVQNLHRWIKNGKKRFTKSTPIRVPDLDCRIISDYFVHSLK